jgi:predicted nucleotidyltransferase
MDNKKLKKIIEDIKEVTVKELKDKGLISLYLSGTILTKDRVKLSDIDLFGIVGPEFDIIKEENKINSEFEKRRKTFMIVLYAN